MDSMLALLVADDPRRSADRILTRLIQIHQAQGGAILRPSGGQVEIWMSAGLNLGAVSELPVRWADHREALEAGRAIVEPGFALLPAMLGEELVAALYLAQPQGQAVADARLFGTAIAQAVLASTADRGAESRPGAEPHRGGAPAAALAPRAARVEHRGGRPAAERHAAHRLHAPAQLRDRAQARTQDLQEDARGRMTDLQLLVAHAVEARAPRAPRGDRVARAGEAVLVVRRSTSWPILARERPRLVLARPILHPLVLGAEAGRLRRPQDGDRPRARLAGVRGLSRRGADGSGR